MTPEELGEHWREEHSAKGIRALRPDFYESMASLVRECRIRCRELTPDSPEWDAADRLRQSVQTRAKALVEERAEKICRMAFLSACGGKVSVVSLTDGEKTLFQQVRDDVADHLDSVIRRWHA